MIHRLHNFLLIYFVISSFCFTFVSGYVTRFVFLCAKINKNVGITKYFVCFLCKIMLMQTKVLAYGRQGR
nr:MAG TPA: hypothetical protein [Caudoviricetes sp.]